VLVLSSFNIVISVFCESLLQLAKKKRRHSAFSIQEDLRKIIKNRMPVN